MKDKLIRIKRSRLKTEELFLIDMINDLEILDYNGSTYWVKYRKGEKYTYIETYFTYKPDKKSISIDKVLVFDPFYVLYRKDILTTKILQDFCVMYLNKEITEYKLCGM